MSVLPPADPGATPVSARSPAPDLARGGMLLLIALANVHIWIYGGSTGLRGYPAELDAADRVVVLLQTALVDGRAYPLFALLFGYGLTQLAWRRAGAGIPAASVVALVRRRSRAMLLIGFTHGLLLWSGDVVGGYGLIALVLAGVLVAGRDTTLVVFAVVGATLVTLTGLGNGIPLSSVPGSADAALLMGSVAVDAWLPSAGLRAFEWIGSLLGTALSTSGMVALGTWAARRRLLDDPAQHRPLLTRIAVAGVAGGVLAGVPHALVTAELWTSPPLGLSLLGAALHGLGGLAAGVGYAAAFGLAATRIADRPGPVGRALLATGRRSLSCYLAQSLAFAPFAAWGFGLGGIATVWQASLYALGVWLVTVLVAVLSERTGRRGPAESLLRSLTYGRSTTPVG